MTTKIKNWLTVTVMAVTISNASCTLDEYNPSGYTMDALSASVEGYQTILFRRVILYGLQAGSCQHSHRRLLGRTRSSFFYR